MKKESLKKTLFQSNQLLFEISCIMVFLGLCMFDNDFHKDKNFTDTCVEHLKFDKSISWQFFSPTFLFFMYIWRMTPQSEALSLGPVCGSMLISPKPMWKPYTLDMICIRDSILLRYLHRNFENIQQFWGNWLTTEPGSRILGLGCGVIIHIFLWY